jgi:predicted amidohydrolase YtcJ
MSGSTTVYSAKKILTMNTYQPEATHVAVRDGRVLGVGSLEDLTYWGDYELDDRFADKVLMPGLVEGHSHLMEGSMWRFHYVGYYGRTGPQGPTHDGLKSIDEVVDYLKGVEAKMEDPEEPLIAWGFDPIYFGEARMIRQDLDRISATRPVVVLHSNLHLINVNTAILEAAGIDNSTNVEGVTKDAAGMPTGELVEMSAMFLALKVTGGSAFAGTADGQSLNNFGAISCRTGVTTASDLFCTLDGDTVTEFTRWTAREDCPIRLVSTYAGTAVPPQEGIARINEVKALESDKLRMSIVKIVTDGSIQGYSGRLKWPGYLNAPNGIWNISPEALKVAVKAYHKAGHQLFIHANGDEASEVALDAIEEALREMPWPDHRHTLQHCQMADEAQFRRMAQLGVGVNLFSNHIYFWGDLHASTIIGPDRAKRLDAAQTAQRIGVPFAIHSDAPVTPMGPLFVAWCAVNRLTANGSILGPNERISLPDALRAITLGAAYSMRMDHEIGSIEVGKWADFAVLEDDPLELPPEALKDVSIWGTVLAGRIFPANLQSG